MASNTRAVSDVAVSDAEEMEFWSIREAARRLQVPYTSLERMVRSGRIKTCRVQKGHRWMHMAPVAVWKDAAALYRPQGGKASGRDVALGFPYNPLEAMAMTPAVYDGFQIVFGHPPRCYVCGCEISLGMRWRWFVPMAYQAIPSSEVPVPAFGCASGHEGTVIRVGRSWWIIGEEGRPPKRVGVKGRAQHIA